MFYVKFTLKDSKKQNTLKESEVLRERPTEIELNNKRLDMKKRFYRSFRQRAQFVDIEVIPDTYEPDEAMV